MLRKELANANVDVSGASEEVRPPRMACFSAADAMHTFRSSCHCCCLGSDVPLALMQLYAATPLTAAIAAAASAALPLLRCSACSAAASIMLREATNEHDCRR